MEGHSGQFDSQGGASFMDAPLFIAAAHELKSPLALIRQLSLGLERGEMNAKEHETLARQITLTSERALRLTTDLTKTARLENSLFSLEPLNPVSLCEEVVEEIRPLFMAKNRSINVSPRVRPLLAIANKDLLRRILLNFVDNALHYSEDAPVVISASAKNGNVRLAVRDYGPALSANMWKSLSESLGVTAQPLHNRPGSSGLGIYISQQFADAMNARVGALRHRDGATFYVDISASTQMRLF